jgi:hypothetical protein
MAAMFTRLTSAVKLEMEQLKFQNVTLEITEGDLQCAADFLHSCEMHLDYSRAIISGK